MGAVGGLLGLNGGAGGTGYSAPQMANLTNPVTPTQQSAAYQGTQNAMGSQQALLGALQGQQGVQNQSNVYGQLQNIVAGQGPNPAQTMLNQATGANVANQAALMAGQRGAGQNVGLMARQIAQQGAATQQQAVGQGATMQAQQSLGALGTAGTMANTQAANQIGQTNANVGAQQGEQQALLNAQAQYNNAQAGMQSNVNSANAGLAGSTMGMAGSLIGGIGAGAAAGMMMGMAAGGEVQKMADGGAFTGAGPQSQFGQFLVSQANISPIANTPVDMSGAQAGQEAMNKAGNALGKYMATPSAASPTTMTMAGDPTDSMSNAAPSSPGASMGDDIGPTFAAAKGGTVPALMSPGEIYLTPEAVTKVRNGADPMHVGTKIRGKAPVGGAVNSYDNDIVPVKAKVGGIVVPNSETKSKNPSKNSKDFVDSVVAKRRVKK